jgi:hypothetical protein
MLDRTYSGVVNKEQTLEFSPSVLKNKTLIDFLTVPCRFGPICSAQLPWERRPCIHFFAEHYAVDHFSAFAEPQGLLLPGCRCHRIGLLAKRGRSLPKG